jgi:hypothetical protein
VHVVLFPWGGLNGSEHEVAYAARLERPRGLEVLQLEIYVAVANVSVCSSRGGREISKYVIYQPAA